MSHLEEFKKIIDDFVKDLLVSYPEFEPKFDVINYDEYYSHCENVYPENFFNILYENDELYSDVSICLLPEIDFKVIFEDDKLSDESKKMIWKYLQLILFCVCKGLKNGEDFGDANYLFQAINEEDLQDKIHDTINEMKKCFFNDEDASMNTGEKEENDEFMNDLSNNMFDNMMNEDELKDHLNGLMNGNIGKLAKEIADEASKDFGLDNIDEKSDPKDLLEGFFKNPSKLLNMVKNIGNKLEDKIKSGDLKESELLEEAQEIMSKMKDMPGVKEMMSNMGLGGKGGNFDMKGMMNKMAQNMKQSKTKERMQDKLKKKKEEAEKKENFSNITQVGEDTFVWNDSNSNPNEPLSKSTKKRSSKPNKKKKKKKKN
uniref:Uncharacterized protein n=1 Tax=Florenciella sp. virus SA2 TaxID=3240092 RepID=A0AB39JA84_9VIRU